MQSLRPPRLAALLALLVSAPLAAQRLPLRVDLPAAEPGLVLPVRGGLPMPRGALRSSDQLRLLGRGGVELPCQVRRTASWPDGSLKWVLIDLLWSPARGTELVLEYGRDVRRQPIADPLRAALDASGLSIGGAGVAARIECGTPAVLDQLRLGEREIFAPGRALQLALFARRLGPDAGPDALPPLSYAPGGPATPLDEARVAIEELAIEDPGPLRVTVRLRGALVLPQLGATLPEALRRHDPPGRLPFSLRLSFYRGLELLSGQHQIVFTGEPDRDFIARWALVLPGWDGERGAQVLEPGANPDRLCAAPLRTGVALIRRGWYERPCAITHEGGAAWIEFWPRAAGLWDLRRYAREWAVGESGDATDRQAMRRYAAVAAYGMAKSHDFALCFGDAPPAALESEGRLLAPPGWYAASGALGHYAASERLRGEHAELERLTRREIDYHLFCQDLYRWHGKLAYGNWQTRFGQVHRHDRWECDYGRWGWALNDGAGRIGHMLMLWYLRTLDRRYLDAGTAFNRVIYDTAMVHTHSHHRGAKEWLPARGSTHRHNVQPFGCPYVGLRGSNPGGARIQHLLTGDGVIGDGLELVAEAAWRAAQGHRIWLGQSGGSDGIGTAAMALLWKHETSGEARYLAASRALLMEETALPLNARGRLGYGPGFGTVLAAVECAELDGDEELHARLLALARRAADGADRSELLPALAWAYRTTGREDLRRALEAELVAAVAKRTPSLADLPIERWPGHAGWRTPGLAPNFARDYPYALGALSPDTGLEWPRATAPAAPLPAAPPRDWQRSGGAQRSGEVPPTPAALERLRPTGREAPPGAGALALSPFAEIGGERLRGAPLWIAREARRSLVVRRRAGPVNFVVRMRTTRVDGHPAQRIEVLCRAPREGGPLATWGIEIPLELSADPHAIQATAPGRFRFERCRSDQNDERIPGWLTSETRFGTDHPGWPRWRLFGLAVGPGRGYRIWRASGLDVAPVVTDAGVGARAWLDLCDRGAEPRWGLSARLLRPVGNAAGRDRQALRLDLESGLLTIEFHDRAAAPLAAGTATGAVDLLRHEGWRPPLAPAELSPEQYERFLDDLDYGEMYGLLALRFRLSPTHKVRGRHWVERIRDLGIEPSELLYSMQWRDGLAAHCRRLGTRWDPTDLEGSVRRILARYRKR